MARPIEVGTVKRVTVNLDETQARVVDEISYTKQGDQKIKGEAAAIRYLIDKAINEGKIARVKRPAAIARSLPRVVGVCCGDPATLAEAIETAGEIEVTDTAALAWATEHAWVGVANGWSMCDGSYPHSISEGDELLMIPIDEWKHGIKTGTAVLSYIRLKDGTEGCSLKEHLGKTLRARNPDYKKIDFGLGGDVEYACPLAICVYRLGRCMV